MNSISGYAVQLIKHVDTKTSVSIAYIFKHTSTQTTKQHYNGNICST